MAKNKKEKLLQSFDSPEIENIAYILQNLKSKKYNNDFQTESNEIELLEEKDLEKFAEYLEEEEGELSLDIYEDDKYLYIVAPLAGVSAKNIDINYNQGVLTIKGERKLDKDLSKKNYFVKECFWGKFSRSILLPVDVDSSKIKAIFKNGVLKISLPKLDLPVNVDIKPEEK